MQRVYLAASPPLRIYRLHSSSSKCEPLVRPYCHLCTTTTSLAAKELGHESHPRRRPSFFHHSSSKHHPSIAHTMSTPSSNKVTPTPHSRSDKVKKSRIATLKLSPQLLSSFSSAPKKEVAKSSPSSQSASTPKVEVDEKPASANDDPSEMNLTPVPAVIPFTDSPNPDQPVKKRKGPAPGSKRGLGQGVDNGLPKPRGKPGPKKKPRL
jgi:hypothetical protein